MNPFFSGTGLVRMLLSLAILFSTSGKKCTMRDIVKRYIARVWLPGTRKDQVEVRWCTRVQQQRSGYQRSHELGEPQDQTCGRPQCAQKVSASGIDGSRTEFH